jgi:hypothetical protein
MVSAVMNRYYPDEYMKIMYLMENKISILLGNEEEYNTLEIREEQYENAMKRNYGIISKVLGCGLSNVTYDAYLAHKGYIFIENQYDLLKICLGYIGFTFYVLFIVIAGTGAILMKRVTNQTKMLFFLSILIFAINSKTLIPLVLFSNTAFFALFYAFFKRVQNDNSFYLANFINK